MKVKSLQFDFNDVILEVALRGGHTSMLTIKNDNTYEEILKLHGDALKSESGSFVSGYIRLWPSICLFGLFVIIVMVTSSWHETVSVDSVLLVLWAFIKEHPLFTGLTVLAAFSVFLLVNNELDSDVVIGNIKKERNVDKIMEYLNLDSGRFRRTAIESLNQLKGKSVIEPLIMLLKNDDPSIREAVAKALGRSKGFRAVDPLIKLLKDNSWNVRSAAAEALGQLRDPRAVDPLIKLLKDNSWDVCSAAIKALEKLVWTDDQKILGYIRMLQSEDSVARINAAEALGHFRDSRAVDPLIKLLKDNSWNVCSAAAEALGQLGDKRAVDSLFELLNSEAIKNVSEVVVISMSNLGELLNNKANNNVRKAVAISLSKLDDIRALPSLLSIENPIQLPSYKEKVGHVESVYKEGNDKTGSYYEDEFVITGYKTITPDPIWDYDLVAAIEHLEHIEKTLHGNSPTSIKPV